MQFQGRSAIATCYAIVCLLSAVMVLVSNRAELAGLLFVALGLPWSIAVTGLVLSTGSSSAWGLAIGYVASCVLNAWLIDKYCNKLRAR
jgi:ABC-type maltose transport system permease subunit